MDWIPAYDPIVETSVGIFLFLFWLGCNSWYWLKVWDRVQFCLKVIDDVNIGWMIYSFKGPGKKGQFCSEKFINDPTLDKPSKFKALLIKLGLARSTTNKDKEMKRGSVSGKPPTPKAADQTSNVNSKGDVEMGKDLPLSKQTSDTDKRRDLLTQDSMATVGSIGDRL